MKKRRLKDSMKKRELVFIAFLVAFGCSTIVLMVMIPWTEISLDPSYRYNPEMTETRNITVAYKDYSGLDSPTFFLDTEGRRYIACSIKDGCRECYRDIGLGQLSLLEVGKQYEITVITNDDSAYWDSEYCISINKYGENNE